MSDGDGGGDGVLRRVVVYEDGSGICLFSQTWGQWKGDQTRGKVCSLVQFFLQLAREIDSADADVSRVAFQEPMRVGRPRTGQFHSRFTANAPPRSSSKKSPPGSDLVADGFGLNMSCAQESGLVAAVFYEYNTDVDTMKMLAQTIVKKFAEKYGAMMEEMAGLFDEAAKKPDFVVDEDSFMAPFQDFTDVISELRATSR
jgi:hypothetical protein